MRQIFVLAFFFFSFLFAENEPETHFLQKWSPGLRERFYLLHSSQIFSSSKWDVLVDADSLWLLSQYGISFRPVVGSFALAQVSLKELEALSSDSHVKYVEALGHRCIPLLDQSVREIGADKIWQGLSGISATGKGVLIGIYDSGIDWAHPDFIRADGTSRIRFLWDQTDNTGPPPSGFSYGTEYDQEAITHAIRGFSSNSIRSKDKTGHGTHVAGIACGNGRGTGNHQPAYRYIGIAPEAELIVVKGGDSAFLDTWILNGLRYLFDKASLLGMPMVVNLSMGKQTHDGPHDGTSLFEQAVDAFLEIPGRAMVVAGGNDGGKPIHFKIPFTGAPVELEFEIGENRLGQEDFVGIEAWSPPSVDGPVSIMSAKGNWYGPFSSGVSTVFETGEGKIYVDNASGGINPYNGDKALRIRISDSPLQDNLSSGTWKLRFSGGFGRLDAWIYDATLEARWVTPDYSCLLAEPGHARRVITVGSYISRIEWPSLWQDPWGPGGLLLGAISPSSSPGPPRPNSMGSSPLGKPELVAPGEYVLSSLSRDKTPFPSEHYIATDSVHWASKGTSVACPHVTGTIALLFEKHPSWTASEVKAVLIASARKTQAMGGKSWDPSWGYGKLDAYGAWLCSDVEEKSVPLEKTWVLHAPFPNPFNNVVSIPLEIRDSFPHHPWTLAVFDLRGKWITTLFSGALPPGYHVFQWNGKNYRGEIMSSGIYVIRLRIAQTQSVQKICYLR